MSIRSSSSETAIGKQALGKEAAGKGAESLGKVRSAASSRLLTLTLPLGLPAAFSASLPTARLPTAALVREQPRAVSRC
jgi:hypothetical protein